jgi:putative restriction endonuclease
MPKRNWTREELILAFNLYFKIPFGQIDDDTPEIISLAKILNRTPGAVALKLANFAHLDPSLQKRNVVGLSHGSKLDVVVWNEFYGNLEELSFESEVLLAEKTNKKVEEISGVYVLDLPKEGKEREALVKIRVNQNFFRSAVLAAYDFKCCITGLEIPELLNASHIIPWSKDKANQVNPRNGLCLNAIHDRAFDRYLITVTPEFIVKVSKSFKKENASDAVKDFLLRYDGAKINKPARFLPDPIFLKSHNRIFFEHEKH